MDEFTALGKLPIVEKAAGFMAGYGLRLIIIVQSVAQLISTYTENGAKAILDNSAVQIVYPPKDVKDAKVVSETLGYLGNKVKSTSRNRGGSGGGSSGESESEQQRALLLPQEVRELPRTEEIVLAEYTRPILASKIVYYKDPAFAARLMPAPALPVIDLGLRCAELNSYVRIAAHSDVVDGAIAFEQLAGNAVLNVADESAFVNGFFDEFCEIKPPNALEPSGTDRELEPLVQQDEPVEEVRGSESFF
jgi:type IV secretion system protein VirD4